MLKSVHFPDYILKGKDWIPELADFTIHYGDVVLIVSDIDTDRKGYNRELARIFEEMGVTHELILVGEEWLSIEEVKRLWSDCEWKHEPNVIISLGEARVMHFAKAISILAPYIGSLSELFEGKGHVKSTLPHLAVPLSSTMNWMEELKLLIMKEEKTGQWVELMHKDLIPKVVVSL